MRLKSEAIIYRLKNKKVLLMYKQEILLNLRSVPDEDKLQKKKI